MEGLQPARVCRTLQGHAAAGQHGDYGPRCAAGQTVKAEERHGLHHFRQAVDAVQIRRQDGAVPGKIPLDRLANIVAEASCRVFRHAVHDGVGRPTFPVRRRVGRSGYFTEAHAAPCRKTAGKIGKGLPKRLEDGHSQRINHVCSFARRHPAVPTLLRIVVSCKEQSKKRAGKEPSRVKCHTAAHGGGSEEALCGKHVAAMQKAEAGPLKGRAARHAPALAKRPVRAKRMFRTARTAAIPSSPEFTPHRAITCPRATGPSIWPSRSVIL